MICRKNTDQQQIWLFFSNCCWIAANSLKITPEQQCQIRGLGNSPGQYYKFQEGVHGCEGKQSGLSVDAFEGKHLSWICGVDSLRTQGVERDWKSVLVLGHTPVWKSTKIDSSGQGKRRWPGSGLRRLRVQKFGVTFCLVGPWLSTFMNGSCQWEKMVKTTEQCAEREVQKIKNYVSSANTYFIQSVLVVWTSCLKGKLTCFPKWCIFKWCWTPMESDEPEVLLHLCTQLSKWTHN